MTGGEVHVRVGVDASDAKVLLCPCATGVFSFCRIARNLAEDAAFRVSGAGNLPAASGAVRVAP